MNAKMVKNVLTVWAAIGAVGLSLGHAVVTKPGKDLAQVRDKDARLAAVRRVAAARNYEITDVLSTAGCVRISYTLRPTDESHIRCQLAMPTDRPWNGRFWGFGNGGGAGWVKVPLEVAMRGEVAVHTDMGTSRGVYGKREVVRDFGWRATHLMTVSGKALAEAFFGRKPSRNYFFGSSTGGGQGFHEALRFPEDYDGIIANVPANTRIPLHVYFAWNQRLMKDAAGRDVFTKEELAAVRQAALDWFADKDTPAARGRYLTDTRHAPEAEKGILALARAKRPSLAEGDKLERLHKMFVGPVLNGKRIHAGVPFSASFAAAAGQEWMLKWYLGPDRAPYSVTDAELLRWLEEWGPDCDACGEGFSKFAARGGKMIVTGGLVDSIVPYPSMIDWYARAAVECGGRAKLEDACRLYLFPNRGHCQLVSDRGLIVRWVENGEAPGEIPFTIPGSQIARAAVGGAGRATAANAVPEMPAPVVVAAANGYNSWPMLGTTGGRLVCVYSRGSEHTIGEGARGAFACVSADGGRTWGAPHLVADDPGCGEVPIGKGHDAGGALLVWIRCCGGRGGTHHDLYRSTDGVRFERLVELRPNPMPMQITDVFSRDGKLVSFWFATDYNRKKNNSSWGLVESADNGRTWKQRVIERDLPVAELPTEQSGIYLGNGRLLAIARCEDGRAQFQLVSTDGGVTWTKRRTNIADVSASTPSLIYDAATDTVANYYFQRGPGLQKVRIAKVRDILTRPEAWPEPRVLAQGGTGRPWDSGNANAVAFGGRHYVSWYAGDQRNTAVYVLWRMPGGK